MKELVFDSVLCHFDEGQGPTVVRLGWRSDRVEGSQT
jgi:hypothetical protein